MSTISTRLPASLHEGIREAATREGISIHQFIASAAGDKLAEWNSEEYLSKRAQRGNRVRFEAAVAHVPDHPPDPDDAI